LRKQLIPLDTAIESYSFPTKNLSSISPEAIEERRKQLVEFLNSCIKLENEKVEFFLHAFLQVPTFTMGFKNARKLHPKTVLKAHKNVIVEDIKAINIYIHGGLAHAGHAFTIAEALLPHSIATYSFDLRGFGHWIGQSGHVDSGDYLLRDTDCFIDFIQKRHPGKPLILSGHSLGGMLALAYLGNNQQKFKCAIVCAPWLKNKIALNPVLNAMSGVVNKLAPTFSQPPAFSIDDLTHDEEIKAQHAKDRLMYKKEEVSVRFYEESLKLQQFAIEQAKKIELPLIMFFGGQDRLADETVGKAAYETIKSKEKEWIYYPEFFHEVWFEKGREDSLVKVAAWATKYIN